MTNKTNSGSRERLVLSVVVPCFNEAGNIPELVVRLAAVFEKKGISGEVVLVNDGSSDNTGETIDRLGAETAIVKPVHHSANKGMEEAWKSGIREAKGTYVCLIDADLQYQPEDVWRLYREILFARVDLVQGYRSSIGRLKDSRYILSKGLNFTLNALFGMRAKDNKSGFVIALRPVLMDILTHRFNYRYFQTFITVSAHAKGYRIREIETIFESRLAGKSFMSRFPTSVIVWCLIDIIKGFVEFRLFPKRENLVREYLNKNTPKRSDPALEGWRKALFEAYFHTTMLHKWLITRRARSYYFELKKSQWLSPEQIKELQELKLRSLINHAYYHVGYYRDLFDAHGIAPADIQTVEDLHNIPLINKDIIRENLYCDFLSDTYQRNEILKITTSGSTGEPFTLYADRHQLEIRWASTMRSMEWTGYKIGDKQARLWHQTLGMTPLQVMREKIDAAFMRRIFIPAFSLSEENLREMIEKIEQYDPVLIDGYAESFNFLALYLKSGKDIRIRPKALISSAQSLPRESREIIEEAFGCRVFDKYGSREFSGIAYECGAHSGHHVVAESYIVEVLKDGKPAKPGEVGEVVITDLNNFCMPFIRYRVGDLAVAVDNSKPCECGRGLPMLGDIQGRVQAIVHGTNGVYLPGTFFAHLFKDYSYLLRQYRIIQYELGKITLEIVKSPRFSEPEFSKLLEVLRRYLGSDMKIDVKFVEEIPLGRTGKRQAVISHLDLDFQKLPGDVMETPVIH